MAGRKKMWVASIYVFKDPRRTRDYVVEYKIVRCKNLESALRSAQNMLYMLRKDIKGTRNHYIEYVNVEVRRERR